MFHQIEPSDLMLFHGNNIIIQGKEDLNFNKMSQKHVIRLQILNLILLDKIVLFDRKELLF